MMLMEHVPLALVHLLNTHRCILDMVVVHVGESNFFRVSNKQQRINVAAMTTRTKKLLKSVDMHSEGCCAIFYSHMLSFPGMLDGQATCGLLS